MEGKSITDEVSASKIPILPLLQGTTTLTEALEEEENMHVRLRYPTQRADFFLWVYQHRKDFEAIVSYHLGLDNGETCRFGDPKEWKHGSFNLCVPIQTHNWRKHPGKRVMLRIPLPYKVGESTYPGNADEKPCKPD
ncbi:hypothetical protein K469DRAFT_599796 [Zopfia rhizophila CBS 207.26]|uniref:Uncharacterized protein n=1 Tax=Zopfia rhizophila CBS 207.26 TaxID=1314779 RepID=A0A6A6DIM0_9PEZI|nr:hypothetical protein K469DRAFT_599796 [Zopfia rhizophila CBS 207.26]